VLVSELGVTAGIRIRVRARVRDAYGYEAPGYEKVRVQNVGN